MSAMKFSLVIGVFACVLTAVIGLDCYLCMGSADSDCNGTSNATMMIQHCPTYEQSNTFCVAYNGLDTAAMSAGFVRGCGFITKDDNRTMCEYLISTNMAKECTHCDTDLCNF